MVSLFHVNNRPRVPFFSIGILRCYCFLSFHGLLVVGFVAKNRALQYVRKKELFKIPLFTL